MSAEPVTALRPARKPRISQGERLRAEVLKLANGRATVMHHSERAWASITFSGARHSLRLLFEGADKVGAGEALIASLPDHEFTIPGQLVADATVISASHSLLPHPKLEVECELLLLADA